MRNNVKGYSQKLYTQYIMRSECKGFNILYEPNVKGYVDCRLIFYYFAFKKYIYTYFSPCQKAKILGEKQYSTLVKTISKGEEEKISRQSNAL